MMIKSLLLALSATSALGQFVALPVQGITFPSFPSVGLPSRDAFPSTCCQSQDPECIACRAAAPSFPNPGLPSRDTFPSICCQSQDPECIACRAAAPSFPNPGLPSRDTFPSICCQSQDPECIACRAAAPSFPSPGLPSRDTFTGTCCQSQDPECIACRLTAANAYACITNPTRVGCNGDAGVVVPPLGSIQPWRMRRSADDSSESSGSASSASPQLALAGFLSLLAGLMA